VSYTTSGDALEVVDVWVRNGRKRSAIATSLPGFRDDSQRRPDDRIEEAKRLQASDPAGLENRARIEFEHQLIEDAVWVPLTNPSSAYDFSARTEKVHPPWGSCSAASGSSSGRHLYGARRNARTASTRRC
jgi:hypothetical protein